MTTAAQRDATGEWGDDYHPHARVLWERSTLIVEKRSGYQHHLPSLGFLLDEWEHQPMTRWIKLRASMADVAAVVADLRAAGFTVAVEDAR